MSSEAREHRPQHGPDGPVGPGHVDDEHGEHADRAAHGHGHAYRYGSGSPGSAADIERVGTFLRTALEAGGCPNGPLLEVGAGDGALAAWLGERGVAVTAIDVNPEAVARATAAGRTVQEADFLTYEPPADAPGLQAVAFTLSLHHIDDVAAALARAAALVPGGLILLDEFAYERADAAATAFFFDQRAVLAAAGLDRDGDAPTEGDPSAAWARRYSEEHRIATGEQMLGALARHCDEVAVHPGPHLARLVSFHLDASIGPAEAVARRLFDLESARIAAGTLPAIGLRVVAKVRQPG
jgi:hypothetical protein